MSKDKLFVSDRRNGTYAITWWLADDNEEGATLGETEYNADHLANMSGDAWEHIKATLTAEKTSGVERDINGYFWEDRQSANAALRAIKIALKDKSDKPMPDWAVKALAEGWKPPKNWSR